MQDLCLIGVRLMRKHQITQNTSHRKGKRSQDSEAPHEPNPAEKHRKRAQILAASASIEENSKPNLASTPKEEERNPIRYWSRHGRWPEEYFEQDDQTREFLFRDLEAESWFEKYWWPNMSHLLARKRSYTSLARKRSDSSSVTPSSTTPSDEKPREAKSAPYARPSYATILATKGSFMDESEGGITDKSKRNYYGLLKDKAEIPENSLFRDDTFKTTCRKLQDRNEARVIQDITRLIVPSAETLATYGAPQISFLIEGVNEG